MAWKNKELLPKKPIIQKQGIAASHLEKLRVMRQVLECVEDSLGDNGQGGTRRNSVLKPFSVGHRRMVEKFICFAKPMFRGVKMKIVEPYYLSPNCAVEAQWKKL